MPQLPSIEDILLIRLFAGLSIKHDIVVPFRGVLFLKSDFDVLELVVHRFLAIAVGAALLSAAALSAVLSHVPV